MVEPAPSAPLLNPQSPLEIRINVRFAGDGSTERLSMSGNKTSQDLRSSVLSLRPELRGKLVRLIYQGKLLQDHVTLSNAGLADDAYVHCVVSDAPPSTAASRVVNITSGAAAAAAAAGAVSPDPSRPVGFERLREMGVAAEDVAEYRLQFQLYRSMRGLDTPSDPEQLRQLEEEWMTSGGGGSVSRVDGSGAQDGTGDDSMFPDMIGMQRVQQGTYGHMLAGLLLGFLIGIFMLLWVLEGRSTPTRMKMGIILGVSFNVIFGFVRNLMAWS